MGAAWHLGNCFILNQVSSAQEMPKYWQEGGKLVSMITLLKLQTKF